MTLGPILGCELRVMARRAKSYRQRCSLAVALSLAIGTLLVMAQRGIGGRLSLQEAALFAQFVFAAVTAIQVVLTFWLVPALVAGSIAQERERRTLDSLLTTRLSSAEIVVGKLLGGLMQYAACLLTTLPIMILLSLLGGIDPRLVMLTHAGTGSLAFFVAGLSMLISTWERRAARALNQTIAVAAAWCILPAVFQAVVPRLSPLVWYWTRTYVAWLAASSPNSVAESVLRFGLGPRFMDSIMWMILLQLTGGAVLISLSIARLRRSSRRQAEGAGARSMYSRRWVGLRGRFFPKPTCGEDPVLWKEIHTSRVPGTAEVLAVFVAVSLIGLIGWGTYSFGRPAFIELSHEGFASSGSGSRRADFNRFLSHVSSWVEFVLFLIVAGVAATSVTVERACDTWDSLIATPLGGREILRGKMLGTAWKVRWGVALLVLLWLLGLVSGSLHPIGLVAAVVVLSVSIWFMIALGTYASLTSRDTAAASNRALIPALLLSGSFLVCYIPSKFSTVFMGAGSAPFVNWLCLVSHGEIREVLSGEPTFRRLEEMNIYSYESGLRVLGACLISIAAFAAAAVCLSRAAFNRFDRVVGRPECLNEGRSDRSSSASASRPGWRKRVALIVVSFVIVLLITLVVWSDLAARSLRQALAETARLCPGWESEAGEADRSLATCRALLNVGRSIGDEPALVSQRRRIELRDQVCRQVERVLAHGQPSAAALELMQSSLDAEEGEPLLVFGIRGERAIVDRFLSAVDSGEFTRTQLRSAGFAFSDVVLWRNDELRAVQLRFDNRAERIAALPVEDQLSAFEELVDDARKLPYASRMFAPAILRIATLCVISRARLRCAATALACERYRLAHGTWPSALADLVPDFIPRLPIDPFGGKPLRFRRAKDEVAIYSVGEDRRDDGGGTETVPRTSAGKDLEFHLWDPASRHQPLRPQSGLGAESRAMNADGPGVNPGPRRV